VADGEERKKQSPLVWVLGGCGGVLVLGVCIACIGPSVFGMAMMGLDDMSFGGTPPVPTPWPVETYDAAGLTGGPVLPLPAGPIRPSLAQLDPSQDLAPRRVRFVIASVAQSTRFSVGQECVAVIERRMLEGSDYRCHADVSCGEMVLYGGPSQGFFPCQMLMNDRRDVTGSDDASTEVDGDAEFRIDTTISHIAMRDTTGALGEYNIAGTMLAIE
jgi:hypothetical protein